MNRLPVLIRLCLLTATFLFLWGIQTVHAQVNEDTRWRDAVVTELDVDFSGTGFHARWSFHRCECGDLTIQLEQIAPDGVLTGELLMVDGQVLLARDFDDQDADIEALIQAPSLMMQLANAMLMRSQPKGPDAVSEKQFWDETEELIDFRLNTGLATGIFAAPWRIKGSGWKTESGQYRFELLFEFTNSMPGEDPRTDSITLTGLLDFSRQAFPYSGSTILEDWRVQWISRNERESKQAEKGLTLQKLRQQTKNR